MILNKPDVSEHAIEEFLSGKGRLAKKERIRKIDVPYSANAAYVYTNEENGIVRLTREKFKPFIFAKTLDFNLHFKRRIVEVTEKDYNPDKKYFYAREIGGKRKRYDINKFNILLGKIPNKEDRYAFSIFLHSYDERKKYYKSKLKEYNIIVTTTKSSFDPTDNNINYRLKTGFNQIYTILPPVSSDNKKQVHNYSRNPVFKYKKNGDLNRINGSYTNLISFFKEGGLDPYKRNGVFFDSNKIINWFNSVSIYDKRKFYLKTLPFFKNKKECMEIEEFFSFTMNNVKVLKHLNNEFSEELTEFKKAKEIELIKNISFENFTNEKHSFLVNCEDNLTESEFLGNKKTLYISHKSSGIDYFNTIQCLSGIEEIGLNVKAIDEFLVNDIEKIKSSIIDKGFNKIIFSKDDYSKLFGKEQLIYFKRKLVEYFTEFKITVKKTNKLTENKVAEYIDYIGVERVLDSYNDIKDQFIVTLNENYIKSLDLNKANSFNLGGSEKSRSLTKVCLKNNIDLFNVCNPYFLPMSPVSQFMVQTGARCFRGMEYEDLKVLTIDIETRGQMPKKSLSIASRNSNNIYITKLSIKELKDLLKESSNGKSLIDRLENELKIDSSKRILYNGKKYSSVGSFCEFIREYQIDGLAALTPEKGEIFQIGLYCEGHLEKILHADNPKEEKLIIEETYKYIASISPDTILTYNGEGFDYNFMEKRLEYLGGVSEDYFTKELSVRSYIKSIIANNTSIVADEGVKFPSYHLYNRRENASLKVGGASEKYTQTNFIGSNVMDGMFQVKKAAAINTAIPNVKLKDNIIYAGIAKENRVYVKGDEIGKIGSDTGDYFLNEKTGVYFKSEFPITYVHDVYDNNTVKVTKSGDIIYKNKKSLYCYEVGTEFDLIGQCDNSFGFDFENKSVDDIFNGLYDKLKDYEEVVLPKVKYAENVDVEKRKIIYDKLKQFIADTKDIRKILKSIDFSDYIVVNGKNIVERYLIDDLWETQELDRKYAQASFLLCDWMVCDYQIISTMGNASMWKLLMMSWCYHNEITIPDYDKPRKINGGLIGLMKSGFCGKGVKIDASSLYPSVLLAYLAPPLWDITGVTNGFVQFMLNKRLKYKALKNEFKSKGDSVKATFYDLLQLPLKILINSFYGFYGAADVSPFADLLSAHMITAISRQVARHLIRWFESRGFVAVYSHTDGVNFTYGNDIEEYEYISTGKNWLTKNGKKYKGVEAYVAEYNDLFMPHLMGMDIDDMLISAINFAKSNFISLKPYAKSPTGDKGDIVGGLVKKDTSVYLKEFIEPNMMELLRNKGEVYINKYYEYINRIWSYDLSAGDIASNQKLSKTLKQYHTEMKTKRAAYELVIENNIRYDLGDRIYWVNTGVNSGDSDFTVNKDKIGDFIITRDSELKSIKDIIDSFDVEKIKDIIEEKYDKGEFVFSKSRTEYGTMEDKLYLLGTSDEWIKTEWKERNKKMKLEGDEVSANYTLVEVYCHTACFNCEHLLPEDFDKMGVKYNRAKYLTAFVNATENLLIALKPKVRDMLKKDILIQIKQHESIIKYNKYYIKKFNDFDKFKKRKISKKEKNDILLFIEYNQSKLRQDNLDSFVSSNGVITPIEYETLSFYVKYHLIDDLKEILNKKNITFEDISKAGLNKDILHGIFIKPEITEFKKPVFFDDDYELINGVPLEGKEHNQQDTKDLLKVKQIERDFWVEAQLSPNYCFDSIKLNSNEYYVNDDGTYTTKNQYQHDIVLNRKGIVDFLADRPLVEYADMNITF